MLNALAPCKCGTKIHAPFHNANRKIRVGLRLPVAHLKTTAQYATSACGTMHNVSGLVTAIIRTRHGCHNTWIIAYNDNLTSCGIDLLVLYTAEFAGGQACAVHHDVGAFP